MMPWVRWREPLAVLLLVALALQLLLRGMTLGLALDAGDAGGMLGAIPGGDDLLLLVSAAAVAWCASPVASVAGEPPAPSRHAWPIAVTGLIVVGLTVLGWVATALWNVVVLVRWPVPAAGFVLLVAEGLLRLAVPAAALIAVVLAVRRVAAARTVSAASAEPPGPSQAAIQEAADPPAATSAPERLPAAWQADEATGAVWLTADDAAQGRPGISWSEPSGSGSASAPGGLSAGWTPTCRASGTVWNSAGVPRQRVCG